MCWGWGKVKGGGQGGRGQQGWRAGRVKDWVEGGRGKAGVLERT